MRRPADGSKALDINDLQKRVEELRRAWDRYFQGIDRVPPVPVREKLARELNRARVRRDLASTDRSVTGEKEGGAECWCRLE